MKDFNEDDIENLSIEEIQELFKDVFEMPNPMIASLCYQISCPPKPTLCR